MAPRGTECKYLNILVPQIGKAEHEKGVGTAVGLSVSDTPYSSYQAAIRNSS